MFIEMNKRKYIQRARAEKQQETRQKIVAAAMALHEELGPRETTVSAVAERAGVQRLTVYRHFPDDSLLFRACSSQWLELNPPPEPRLDVKEPVAETLLAFYRYFRGTEGMWASVYRDADSVPAMAEPLAEFHDYLDQVRDALVDLLGSSGARPGKATKVTLRHGLAFSTWASLKAQGVSDRAMAVMVAGWVAATRRGDS